METTKVLTSLLVLTLTGPTLGYPYTRGVVSRSSGRTRDQVMDGSLSDYLGGYLQDQPYELPEYQPSYRHAYATPQRPKINAEALAALLPYLTSNNDDYAYDYNTYSDDEGTWYDDVANEDDFAETSDSDNAALLQFLLNHRSGRYSMEDLENLEREAEMEDNTENQLHALMAKKINKKNTLPFLGVRQVAVGVPLPVRKGQKEEAFDVPSTSIRRPVFASQIATSPDQMEPEMKKSAGATISSDSQIPVSGSGARQQGPSTDVAYAHVTPVEDSSNSRSSPVAVPVVDASPKGVAETTMTPFMQSKYDALLKYLDRERKVRQNQDIEEELQQETKSQPQKRFVSEQDDLSQQLANLKKTVV